MSRERLRLAIREVAGQQLETLAGLAVCALREALVDRKHPDRHKTAATILSRLGFAEQHNVNMLAEVKVTDHTEAALADLRRRKELGFSCEKLIEIFGFSGLDRYEKLLAGEPNVIEHRPTEHVGSVQVDR
jgi:hypothetical protein